MNEYTRQRLTSRYPLDPKLSASGYAAGYMPDMVCSFEDLFPQVPPYIIVQVWTGEKIDRIDVSDFERLEAIEKTLLETVERFEEETPDICIVRDEFMLRARKALNDFSRDEIFCETCIRRIYEIAELLYELRHRTSEKTQS